MNQSAFDLLNDKYGPSLPDQQDSRDQGYEPAAGTQSAQDPRDKKPDLKVLDQNSRPEQITKDRPPLTHWQDSQAVQLLSSYLKEFQDQGIHLKQTRNEIPILCFNPGLKGQDQDPDRWSIGTHAMELLDYARADLQELIFNGALNLEQYKGVWL